MLLRIHVLHILSAGNTLHLTEKLCRLATVSHMMSEENMILKLIIVF